MKPAEIERRKPAGPTLEAARTLARLEVPRVVARPSVGLAGELVRVGDRVLDQAEAVRLWVELGDVLGLAERERRPRAWGFLADWLDEAFAVSLEVEVREAKTKLQGRAVLLDGGRRALVRVGPFAVAHLRLHKPGSRTFTGAVAYYFPGSMGVDARNPDPLLSFTSRRIRATRRVLEHAPEVTP